MFFLLPVYQLIASKRSEGDGRQTYLIVPAKCIFCGSITCFCVRLERAVKGLSPHLLALIISIVAQRRNWLLFQAKATVQKPPWWAGQWELMPFKVLDCTHLTHFTPWIGLLWWGGSPEFRCITALILGYYQPPSRKLAITKVDFPALFLPATHKWHSKGEFLSKIIGDESWWGKRKLKAFLEHWSQC